MVEPILTVHNYLKANSRLLFLGIAFALLMAAVMEEDYKHFLHDNAAFGLSPEFIVEDLLMVGFFTLVMLESRRPLLPGGELNGQRRWVLPFAAAAGGVIGPALIVLFGPWSATVREAWAIPTATDIVLVLVAMRLVLGRFSPVRDIIGLLAIIDDVIGVIIILVFFSGGLSQDLLWLLLPIAIFLFSSQVLTKRMQVADYRIYLPLIVPAWFGFHEAGAHAALAGAAVVYAISYDPVTVHMGVERYHHLRNEGQCRPNALLDLEHALRVPVEYVLFFFGATAAVINLSSPEFQMLTVVVAGALLIGKPVGIMAGVLFATKVVKAELPEGVSFKNLLVGAQLAAIGMTVAFFVANQTYSDDTLREAAKLGAFMSLAAIVLGELWKRILRIPIVTHEMPVVFGHHSHELEGVDVSPEDFAEHDREEHHMVHSENTLARVPVSLRDERS